jgi:hypothetical protein
VSGLSGSKESPVDGNNGANDTTSTNVPEDKIIHSHNCIILKYL